MYTSMFFCHFFKGTQLLCTFLFTSLGGKTFQISISCSKSQWDFSKVGYFTPDIIVVNIEKNICGMCQCVNATK